MMEWQTLQTQNLLVVIPCGFKSHYRHHIIKGDVMNKEIFKKNKEELHEYLQFKRRGSKVKSKKGKGSYSRKDKHKSNLYE